LLLAVQVITHAVAKLHRTGFFDNWRITNCKRSGRDLAWSNWRCCVVQRLEV